MTKHTHSSFTKMLLSILLSIIIFIILCTIYTIIIYFSDFSLNNWSFIIIGIISFLILGFLSGNFQQRRGLFWGLGNSILIILLILIIKHFKINNFFEIIKYLAYILASCSGGILGLNFKSFVK